jgi:hypothetical protein
LASTRAAIIREAKVWRASWRVIGSSPAAFHAARAPSLDPVEGEGRRTVPEHESLGVRGAHALRLAPPGGKATKRRTGSALTSPIVPLRVACGPVLPCVK